MTRQTQQQVMELLQHFKLKTLPENGLLYSEELFKIGADDSDANLEELNQLPGSAASSGNTSQQYSRTA